MAVKYVSEFSFPSEYGFHKPASNSGKGIAKGMSGFSKSKAGPSVVTGNSKGTGGGKLATGKAPHFAKGGSVNFEKHSGVNKNSGMGHVSTAEVADKAKGDGALKYARVSDTKSPPATRGEKSSGVQKPAFKSGGHVTTPQRYKAGGSTLHESGCKCNYCSGGMAKKEGGHIKKAEQPVKMGEKKSWNKDDAVSPGSFKRTPPGEKVTNKKAASSKFSAEGRNTEPATKQDGDVERMAGWSDFKEGGHAKGGGMKSGGRVNNLGKYAHPAKKGGHASGGDVKVPGTRTEKSSGTAAKTGKIVNSAPTGTDAHYEHEAGTPGIEPGDYHEIESGDAAAQGGLSRGTSHKKNAAIHAKQDHKGMAGLGSILGALSQGQAGPPPGAPPMGGPPPGAPPMGMGRPMGGPPMAPPMGGPPGMPHMADGGVTHIVHHHIAH